jgi:hypothetical protein
MSKKALLAVVINLIAIVAPVSLLAWKYGLETSVDVSNSKAALPQVFAMGGAVVGGFITAVLAGRLISAEDASFSKVAVRLMAEFKKEAPKKA